MVAIFVVAASALITVPAVVASLETFPNHLFARQLSGFDPSKIPSSCLTTQCRSLESKVATGTCTTLECLCTSEIVNDVKACEQCAIGVNGLTQGDIDSIIQEFAQSCSTAGFPITGVSTSGGSSSVAASVPSVAPGTKATSSAGAGAGAASTATAATSSGGSGSSSSSSTTGPSKSGASTLMAGVFGSFVAIALGALNL